MEPTAMDAGTCSGSHAEERSPRVRVRRGLASRPGRGATAVEYAILLAGITAAVVFGATQLGTQVLGLFGKLRW